MQDIINKAFETLKKGGLILYPTDTVWGIGCDASNSHAVEKIYKLKQRAESKALICLVANDVMLKTYIKNVPEVAYSYFNNNEKPTTIIYNNPQHLASNLIANDNTLAIRIPNHDFCLQLLNKFNGAIVSTSANISGEPTPNSFKEISSDILKGVDYVVNLPDKKTATKPSSIIKLHDDGSVQIIRK
ncbi:L-threonylcarbamoyladenylate synthase [Corallibacter vietnamensis]|uniref:L-threonylcarbamoyladenylate synthase n=1 Tax=Corallibacter vietnamensis TaxID=904130 RepID=A0ABP7H5A5_9FLAO